MKRLAAAFALIAALAALGVSARAFLERAPRLRAGLDVAHVELGEALRLAAHPASVNPSYRLPWAAVLEADAYLRLSPRALTAWAAGLWLLALLLVFALGRELGGTAGGAAAAALWAPVFARLPHGPGTLKQTWLTVLGLLAAALWVRRAKKDSDRASLLAGAGLGLTLLTRGTFVFLPLLSVLLERRRRAGLLAGAALAFLLPWTAMNLASHGRFVPLEDGAMNMNVVTGALGTVFCAHGDYAAFMGDGAGSPLAWAAKTVAAEPARYLRGVAGRVARVLELQPFLFLLAGLALFSRRRDPGVRALGLFAAYFIAVNVAMSIEDNYFEPLWPLLAALSVAPAALLPEPAPRAGAAAARAALVVAAALSGLMAARLVFYEARYGLLALRRSPASEAALDAALAREPGAPWLALADARRRLGREDAAGAVAALGAATPLEGLPRREVLLAWALAKGGRPGLLFDLETAGRDAPSAHGDAQGETAAVYRAVAHEREGRRAEALKAARLAVEQWAAWQGFLTPGREAAADALAPALRAAAYGRFLVRLDQIFEGQGHADLERALLLTALSQRDAEAWRRLFEARLARGERDGAAEALRARERLVKEREARRTAAFDWERLGRPADAAAAFGRILKEDGEDARTWSDRGVALYRAGRKAEAEAALRRALALDPGFDAARRSLDAALSERASRAPTPR